MRLLVLHSTEMVLIMPAKLFSYHNTSSRGNSILSGESISNQSLPIIVLLVTDLLYSEILDERERESGSE